LKFFRAPVSPALSSRRIKAALSGPGFPPNEDDDARMRHSPRQLQEIVSVARNQYQSTPAGKNQDIFIASGRIDYFGQAKHLMTKML
jgi:hypothetical protein